MASYNLQQYISLQIIFHSLGFRPLVPTIHGFQKIVTITLENVCKLVYET